MSAPAPTADCALLEWKAVDSRRLPWDRLFARRADALLRLEWQRVARALQDAGSIGAAIGAADRIVMGSAAAWEDFLFALHAEVGKDFAIATAARLAADHARVKAAEPEPEGWVQIVGEWLASQSGTRIRHIQATTLAQIRAVLIDGARRGLGIPAITKQLTARAPELSRARAAVIARTEVVAAGNLGARAGAMGTGLDLRHEWIATPGRRTRPAHLAANAQTRPASEPFDVMGQRLMFPGDGSLGATAPNLTNCRCTAAYRAR